MTSSVRLERLSDARVRYSPHEEISWRIKKRKTAPLLVLAGVDEVPGIPSVVARRWPRAQRSVWLKSESAEGQEALLRKIRQGLVLSERGINYEELNRLRARKLVVGNTTSKTRPW